MQCCRCGEFASFESSAAMMFDYNQARFARFCGFVSHKAHVVDFRVRALNSKLNTSMVWLTGIYEQSSIRTFELIDDASMVYMPISLLRNNVTTMFARFSSNSFIRDLRITLFTFKRSIDKRIAWQLFEIVTVRHNQLTTIYTHESHRARKLCELTKSRKLR